MSLKVVYGRAGSGKSHFCFNEIKEKINKNEKVYIITPEQFSYTAEKKLFDYIGKASVMNAEVLSFNRMAYRVINEVSGAAKTNLSNSGKAMLIYDILDKNKKQLKFLGKTDKNVELVSTMITELKKHNVGLENLKKVQEETEDTYLKHKLNDVCTLFEAFNNQIQNQYIDENDVLTILAEEIDKTDLFNNTCIYIEEFVGFTPQEYKILEKLLLLAKEVTVTVCTDSIEKVKSMPGTDIFYSNKITVNKIIKIAKDSAVEVEQPIYLEKLYRYKSKELEHLEENLYCNNYKKYNDNVNNIELFLANNPYSEIEHVAKKIVDLVKNNNYRYHDIAIITKNISTYSSLVKAIFNKYEIPVFIDEKKDLNQNILIKYVLAVLEVLSKNWSHEAVFNYIKTGFVDITNDDIFFIENYCLKWGINRSKWYKEEWDFDDEANRANEIRKAVVEPILNFKNKLDRRKTVEQMTLGLYEFLIENNINKKLENKIKKLEEIGQIDLANEYNTSWSILMNVLDEIVLVLGNENISFEKYTAILKMGMTESSLGKIPATLDEVIIGDVDRSRSHKIKAIFMIGVNDGVFPSINKQEGFLDDSDRESLKQSGIELAKTTLENLYESNFNIYKAFTIAEEKLYISYSSTDVDGKNLRPSTLVSKIKKLYPSLKETSDIISNEQISITNKAVTFDELLVNLRKLQDREEIDEIWMDIFQIYNQDKEWKEKLENAVKGIEYTNLPDKINAENIQKLYGNELYTSVSKLEQYRSCPFSFYLKYMLNVSEKELFKIESVDTGSFMHDVIDEFFEYVKEQGIKLKELEEKDIEKIINQIIDEKLQLKKNYIFSSNHKYIILTKRLKKLILKSMKYIIQTLTQSDFEILGNEIEFKEGKQYPPIKVELDTGEKVKITGKIDRIDTAKVEDKNFIRIIDYKSSVKNIDLNEVVAGLQLQLLTYLDAVTKKDDMLPAGVLYFNLLDPIIKASKNMTEEQIEEEIKKKFKMQGLILADVNVVKKMDKTLEKGASSIVPAYLDKDGNISDSRSSSISKEEFENLQKHINKTIKQISKEILQGNIDIKPYYSSKKKKSPCDYCKYKTICQFDAGFCGNEYRYIPNKEKNAVLEEIKNG